MFYLFIALTAVAIAFALLGALIVWVGVLSLALKAMLFAVPAGLIGFLLWQRHVGRKP